jgi:TrmH RNA methyltransferase
MSGVLILVFKLKILMAKKAPIQTNTDLEMKIHGFNACMNVFQSRPQGIIRVYLTEKRLQAASELVRHCVEKKLAYHVSTLEEMDKVAESTHHEGLCMVIRKLKRPGLTDLRVLAEGRGAWLALENVTNPHNLGAIARSAAHFGVKGIFILGERVHFHNGAFYRTAEGGAEACALVAVKNILELKSLCEGLGLTMYSTSSHEADSLYQTKLTEKACFLMGAEGSGLSKEALALNSIKVSIPGTGLVESLNVSVAAALCVGEWSRQQL